MAKKYAWVLGAVFVLVGILGFIGTPIVGSDPSALFVTNTAHNLIHLVSGLLFIVVALVAANSLPTVFKIFGVVYLLVAVLGFLTVPSGGDLLGLVTTNTADHFLHVVLAIVIFAAGMMTGKKGMMSQSTM